MSPRPYPFGVPRAPFGPVCAFRQWDRAEPVELQKLPPNFPRPLGVQPRSFIFAGTHSAADGIAVQLNTTEYKMQELSDKLLLSLDEVRTLTGVGRTNLYREIREKRLKARKRGVKTVVAREDLAEWIQQLPRMSPSSKGYK